MSYCAVFGCPERSPKSDKRFHIFPNPDKFPKRYELWVAFCGNTNFTLGKASTICSGHFKESDYDPSQVLRQKLMGVEFCKPRLKPESIPSIIPENCAKHQTRYSRAKRHQVEKERGEKIVYMSSEKSPATSQRHVNRDTGLFSTVFINSDEKMFAERENAANLHTLGSSEAESEIQAEDPLGGADTTTQKFSQCRGHILGSAAVVKMESEIKSVGAMDGVGSSVYNFPHHAEGTPNDIRKTRNSFPQYADDTPTLAVVSKLTSEVKSEDITNGLNSGEKRFAKRENAANLHTLRSVAFLNAESEVKEEDPLDGAGTTTQKFSQCEDHILGSAAVVKVESEIKSVGTMNGVGSTMYNFPHHAKSIPNDIINTTNSFPQYADDTPKPAAVAKLANEVKSEDITNGLGYVARNLPLCTESTPSACNTTHNFPRSAKELIKVEKDDDSATIQSPAECKSSNGDCSFAVPSNVIIKKEEDLGAEEDAAETLVDNYFNASVVNEEDFERDDGAAVVQSSVDCTSSYASSFVSESNLIVKKEEDLGVVNGVADKLVDDYFHVSVDEEESLDSGKSFQTATVSDEADESINWGFCKEGHGELNEVPRSRLCSTTNDKRHSCPSCPAKFKEKHELNRHLLTHTTFGLYSCAYCPAKFKAKCYYKWHLLTHTNDRLYPCASCPAKFRAKHHLEQHLVTHTVDRVYSCFSCPLKFKTKSLLARHLITHTNDKPYASTAKFKRKGTLIDHLKTRAAKKPSNADKRVEKPFSCTLCASKFRYSDSLVEHLRIHTENPHLFADTAPLNLKLPPV